MPRRRPRHAFRALAAAVSGVLGLGLLAAVPGAAQADHTDLPDRVSLMGSLQSELGCPADWDEGCTANDMAPVADAPGVFEKVADVPAGSYELKVRLDGSWEENYGAGGAPNGPDVPLVLLADAELRFSYDHGTHRIAVAPADPAEPVSEADEELAGTSLREDLTRENFYFVLADRFEDGDPSNNTAGIAGDRLDHGHDPTDKAFYHGGDLQGILDRIDYIEGLGTTAIWLTPSFKNKPVQGTPGSESAGYHGYWITDFTQIDPHLGTNEELRALVDEAHSRGIKVFFDIITNHTADVLGYPDDAYDANGAVPYVSKEEEPYRDADGVEFDDRDYAGGDTFPEVDLDSFPYRPTFLAPGDEAVKVPDWLNDPTMYHNRGTSTFAGEDSEYGDFPSGNRSALDDLWTERPEVVDGMIDIYQTWVRDAGIDGFRVDTVKHVNIEFWQEFGPALEGYAASLGNDDFFMFGEIYDADPRFMSRYTTEGRLQAAVDFGFQSTGSNFAKGQRPTTELRDFFASDDYYTDTDSNAYSLPTFLGNHDMGRIGSFLRQQFPDASDDYLLERDELGHSLMYLTRGQPVVYYGDEQGFGSPGEDFATGGPGGAVNDQIAREDMFPSQVDSYNDNVLIGTDATTADANFDTEHPLYRHIAGLAQLREDHPALADGAQVHRYASNSAGIYAFSRIDADEQVEYVVAANSSDEAKTATFDTYSVEQAFSPVWGADGALTSDVEGRVTVSVPARSVAVYRAAAPLAGDDEAPEPFFRTDGAVVGGRAEIGVGVPGDDFVETTFAWRPVGGDEWTPLGTDDNAPYRVFHDVRGLATGTLLEYRAVARDSDGDLGVTSTWATVGTPAPSGGGTPGGGGPVEQPDAVSVPGSHNSEMGCPGDWQPDCAQAQLSPGTGGQVWTGSYELPAGDFAFKAAINNSWDENYGVGGVRNGSDIPYTSPGGEVSFYYDHRTNWVTNDAMGPIVTGAGSFQSELGCPGDWQPDCLTSWLQDPDGDGTYTFTTTAIPAGSYETKVAHGLSWDENYGAGGAPDGANIAFTVPADGVATTLSYVLETHVLTVGTAVAGPAPDIAVERAHWLAEDLIAWDLPGDVRGWEFRLHWADRGGLEVDAEDLPGGLSRGLALEPAGLPQDVRARFPHLAGLDALRLPDGVDAADVLTGQLAVAAYDDLGRLVDATGLQVPGVLDDLYGEDASALEFGPVVRAGGVDLRLWAPTAKSVALQVYDGPQDDTATTVAMTRDDASGAWTASGPRSWIGAHYRYAVEVWVPETQAVETNEVTDPYSLGLAADSTHSIVVDLDDPRLAPRQWDRLRKPELDRPIETSIYELHVRDFSITDETVPADERGTYKAFTRQRSDGMRHLRDLAASGMNTLHLLPTFDIATIPERREDQAEPPCDLASYPPDSEEQQACIEEVRAQDGFNWGYDPYHYTTPEGSYATDPDGTTRIKEFREMVQGVNRAGLRVVLDVVYNHTTTSGQAETSVLDKVVPGYYHRLNASGAVETSTCCANTATEHTMMGKLMVDSVVTWARDYKVDGFRFDLMGHHSKANMLDVRAALDGLTLVEDGVDGESIYVYGEGWNFGEVANDARFEQATQANMAGTGIGTFNDRLRDAVRGGGPFDDNPRVQGFGSGLWSDPNGDEINGTPGEQRARLELAMDQIKVGLTGNLADYAFVDRTGALVTGADVDYNGSPAGYTAEPSEAVTYVDAHDNETLYDALAYKLPQGTPMADRVRMNTLSLATTALGQGVPFWHAGTDLLRSKSLDRNSYNSGDWFNRVDWSYGSTAFGVGLPPASDNEDKWGYMRPLLADPALRPERADILRSKAMAEELLEIRSSSRLFSLGSAAAVQEKVSFPVPSSASPGVIPMVIDDTRGAGVDRRWSKAVVVFNATPETVTQAVPGTAWQRFTLHPTQARGSDPVVKQARYDLRSGSFTVPGRSVAVFLTR